MTSPNVIAYLEDIFKKQIEEWDNMKTIKIDFVDFWGDLVKTDNYFYNLLATKYNVVIDGRNPDLIFFQLDTEGLIKETNIVCILA